MTPTQQERLYRKYRRSVFDCGGNERQFHYLDQIAKTKAECGVWDYFDALDYEIRLWKTGQVTTRWIV